MEENFYHPLKEEVHHEDSSANAPTQTQSAPKNKPNKKKLYIGVAVAVVLLLLLIISAFALRNNDSSEQDAIIEPTTSDLGTDPTDVPLPTIAPRRIKIVANCRIYDVKPDGTLDEGERNEALCDYGDTIAKDGEQYVYVYNQENYDDGQILLNLQTGNVQNYPENLRFNHFQASSGNVYSTEDFPLRIVYKGTLTNPKAQKLLEFDPSGYGRGGMVEDDYKVLPNANESLIIYQDTTSPMYLSDFNSDEDEASMGVYGGMMILSPQGSRVLEVPNAFQTRWINNNELITLVRSEDNSSVSLRKYNISSDGTYRFVDIYRIANKSTFGEIYSIDVYGEKALLSVYSDQKYFVYEADLSSDTTTLAKYENTPARAVILNSESFLGYGFEACDPTIMVGTPNTKYCPPDGSFGDYKTDVRVYNKTEKDYRILLSLSESYLL